MLLEERLLEERLLEERLLEERLLEESSWGELAHISHTCYRNHNVWVYSEDMF